MCQAAKADGITLIPVSSFRDFAEQQRLFNLYRDQPGRAARPGESDHGDAIAVDLFTDEGADLATIDWLSKNAARFGFVNQLSRDFGTDKKLTSEPWHYGFNHALCSPALSPNALWKILEAP